MIFNGQGQARQLTYFDEPRYRGMGQPADFSLADLGIEPPIIDERGAMAPPIVFLPPNPLDSPTITPRPAVATPSTLDDATAWLKSNQAIVWGTAGTLLALALFAGGRRR